jgi:transcriptional regulator with AAA-type ATPase domain
MSTNNDIDVFKQLQSDVCDREIFGASSNSRENTSTRLRGNVETHIILSAWDSMDWNVRQSMYATTQLFWRPFMSDTDEGFVEEDDTEAIDYLPGELDDLQSDLNDVQNDRLLSSPQSTRLILFQAAMEHVVRVSRLLRLPGAHALLVGIGGSGKRSVANLAAFAAGFETFEVFVPFLCTFSLLLMYVRYQYLRNISFRI